MCGIAFLYDDTRRLEERRDKVARALEAMRHRGPDDSGLMTGEGWAMGHQRLSIIDLQASRQPMRDQHGRYCLAYNGEIYNYRELRQTLEGAWNFRTTGDTEVVLAGLVLKGPAFLKEMQGMWALCLWDSQERQLLLARDRIGKKPLYYRCDTKSCCCASEINALLPMTPDSLQEDADSTADYFRYGFYLPGTSIYAGVREVLAGHYLVWCPESDIKQHSYWELPSQPFDGSIEDARHVLKDKLVTAVKRRLVADVEVGAFLSGGIDSSLVVGVMSEILGVHPKTFTVGFDDKSFDERDYARLAAERYRTEHHESCVSMRDPGKLGSLLLDHVGQPFIDASLLPSSRVSELASRYVKVALSGDGADEVFSGYQRYQSRVLLRWYSRLPRGVRHNLRRVLRAIPEPTAHHSRSVLKKMHLFLDIEQRYQDERPYIAPLMYSRDELGQLIPDLAGRGHTPPKLPVQTTLDDIHAMMAADVLVYLPQDNLLKVDRVSMAHSLEVRSPFVDHDIVEFAFSLPRHWHRSGFKGKRMLRESFDALLPPQLWSRRKQGFSTPVHAWFRQGLQDELQSLVQEVDGPVNAGFVDRMIAEHQTGRRDHGIRLWGIYAYLLWRRDRRLA